MSHAIRATIEIGAPPRRIFEALARAEDLRAWFCQDAEVDPEANRFDFWGAHTPGTPGRDEGRHTLVGWEPPRRLTFEWMVRGERTLVTWIVAPSGDGGTVELHHALPRGRTRREGALTDFWVGALERLKAWLERGVAGFQTDYGSAPGTGHEVTLSADIAAPADEVFRTLVEPASLEQWIAAPGAARVDPRPGGSFDIGWEEGGPIAILALVPPRLLSYSWRFPPEPDTVVTWSLEGSGGATRLTIVHSGFADDDLHGPYLMGWGFFLHRIRLLLETGQGRAAKVTEDDYAETGA